MKGVKERIQAEALDEWRALRKVLLGVAREHPSGERESLVEIAQRLVATVVEAKSTFPVGSWCIRAATPDEPGPDGEWMRERLCRVTAARKGARTDYMYGLRLYRDGVAWNDPGAPFQAEDAGTFWHGLTLLSPICDARVALRCAVTERAEEAQRLQLRVEALNREGHDLRQAARVLVAIGPVYTGAPDV